MHSKAPDATVRLCPAQCPTGPNMAGTAGVFTPSSARRKPATMSDRSVMIEPRGQSACYYRPTVRVHTTLVNCTRKKTATKEKVEPGLLMSCRALLPHLQQETVVSSELGLRSGVASLPSRQGFAQCALQGVLKLDLRIRTVLQQVSFALSTGSLNSYGTGVK